MTEAESGVGALIDHISLPVADIDRAAAFYDPVLATLGMARLKAREGAAIGYGPAHGVVPIFWILARSERGAATPGLGLHISFRAKDRAAVTAFHAAALANGGLDAGEPGPRPHYTAGFWGAFAFDLDGFKIEAVVREGL